MDKDQVALVVLLRELPRQQHGQEQHLQMRQEEDQRAVKPSQQQQQRHEVAAAGPRFLVAANTHLIFSPARGDVKLSQLLYFFRCLHDMRLRGILTAYEALTNTEGSFSVLRDGAASASASTVRRTYSKAVPHALGRLSAQGDPGTVGGTTHPWPHPKTLRCPGAEANSLRNALVAWASEKGERYRAEVEGLNERTLEAAERLVHVVACGDFNFTPQSPFYHLVTRGTMDFSRLSREKLSGQFLMSSKMYPIRSMGHCFAGASAMNAPEASRLLTQVPKGVASSWEKSVRMLFRGSETGGAAQGQNQQQHQQPSSNRQGGQGLPLASCALGVPKQEESFLVSLPFALKSAYAIPPTTPQSRWQSQKGSGDAPSLFEDSQNLEKEAAPSVTPATNPRRSSSKSSSSKSSSSKGSSSKSSSSKSSSSSIPMEEFLEEPAYTAYHGWQKGCIDYIFFSPGNLKVAQVYQLPSLLSQGCVGSCPNLLWPASDHLSLVVDLVPARTPCYQEEPAHSQPCVGEERRESNTARHAADKYWPLYKYTAKDQRRVGSGGRGTKNRPGDLIAFTAWKQTSNVSYVHGPLSDANGERGHVQVRSKSSNTKMPESFRLGFPSDLPLTLIQIVSALNRRGAEGRWCIFINLGT
ncbi:uncharacterized protein LOC34621375 [Cyclospora cayetanensis]|uniref:Uncharacterized protein LOC34621375 n=1 Tax=Cyclospora cayetanensis TaxID=88456 RepID=A0A6P6RWC9_9EIME|nr:uncharacterized protein LOC34621375 [Cyclospora cayetanensis]